MKEPQRKNPQSEKVWIRRGYGAFVPCQNEVKARRKAKTWHLMHQGDEANHPVIGLFKGRTLASTVRTQLYP